MGNINMKKPKRQYKKEVLIKMKYVKLVHLS